MNLSLLTLAEILWFWGSLMVPDFYGISGFEVLCRFFDGSLTVLRLFKVVGKKVNFAKITTWRHNFSCWGFHFTWYCVLGLRARTILKGEKILLTTLSRFKLHKICVLLMIHSARPTAITILASKLFSFVRFLKTRDGRTDKTCENSDYNRSWLWVGLVDHW